MQEREKRRKGASLFLYTEFTRCIKTFALHAVFDLRASVHLSFVCIVNRLNMDKRYDRPIHKHI